MSIGLNGHQIFVWEGNADRVSKLIRRYVEEVGCAAAVGFESDKPSPAMARRTQREFTLSDRGTASSVSGRTTPGATRGSGRYLSKELETRSIWLALN